MTTGRFPGNVCGLSDAIYLSSSGRVRSRAFRIRRLAGPGVASLLLCYRVRIRGATSQPNRRTTVQCGFRKDRGYDSVARQECLRLPHMELLRRQVLPAGRRSCGSAMPDALSSRDESPVLPRDEAARFHSETSSHLASPVQAAWKSLSSPVRHRRMHVQPLPGRRALRVARGQWR